MAPLRAARAWVFDLDGTLSDGGHDFAALKRALRLDPHGPLMEGLDALSGNRRVEAWRAVETWEQELAERAVPAPGAQRLLEILAASGARVGVLTRNTRETALRTLAVTGLDRWFDAQDVLGRHCAAPKPSPDGVARLLGRWRVQPSVAVMVGDAEHDVAAGLAAGTHGVRLADGPTQTRAAVCVRDLAELVDQLDR